MKMIAATKMTKAQRAMDNARVFGSTANGILFNPFFKSILTYFILQKKKKRKKGKFLLKVWGFFLLFLFRE